MKAFYDDLADETPGDAIGSRSPRMIGRWPGGVRFEDAIVPREGFFRGREREAPGIWPESSLSLDVGIARRR